MASIASEQSNSKVSSTSIYTNVFWGTFFAHMVIASANSMTFRFADLVIHLKGNEQTAGLIVSVGTMSALICRTILGQALDHFGLRRVWLITGVLFVAGSVGFLIASQIYPTLYAARILYSIGLAWAITGTNLYVQNQVSHQHRTEALASMGSAGFLGLIIGPIIGDTIFHYSPSESKFEILFSVEIALTLVYLITIYRLSYGEVHLRTQERRPVLQLLIRYQPLWITLVALLMGMTFAFSNVFLTRFVDYQNLGEQSPFYTVYAISAFSCRMVSRKWSRTLGRYVMITTGLISHALAMLSFLFVTSPWMLLIPAALIGYGFAVLFPSVVSLITASYPDANRGTATNIALGSIEVGTFLSAPIIGHIIMMFDGVGYDQAFLSAAVLLIMMTFVFAVVTFGTPDNDREQV